MLHWDLLMNCWFVMITVQALAYINNKKIKELKIVYNGNI